jgi:hypothetical protein
VALDDAKKRDQAMREAVNAQAEELAKQKGGSKNTTTTIVVPPTF